MLSRQQDVVNPNSCLKEDLAVVMEVVRCFSDLIECVGTYDIMSHEVAKIEKSGQASDHVTGNMSSDGWQINLLYSLADNTITILTFN